MARRKTSRRPLVTGVLKKDNMPGECQRNLFARLESLPNPWSLAGQERGELLLTFNTAGQEKSLFLSKKGCVPEIFVTGSPDAHAIEKVLFLAGKNGLFQQADNSPF
jgi:hypothetical protein